MITVVTMVSIEPQVALYASGHTRLILSARRNTEESQLLALGVAIIRGPLEY